MLTRYVSEGIKRATEHFYLILSGFDQKSYYIIVPGDRDAERRIRYCQLIQTMMTTAELPYEIWLHILRFLSTENIRQLRLVNTVFYNLSLDEYHRIKQIGYHYPRNITYPSLWCVF